MENHNVKRGRGRPQKYSTEEERKDAIKQQKSKYMLKKEWYCDICKNGKNYTLAGKSCHLKTRKHVNNTETDDTNILIQPKSMNRKVWLEFIKNDVLFNNTE